MVISCAGKRVGNPLGSILQECESFLLITSTTPQRGAPKIIEAKNVCVKEIHGKDSGVSKERCLFCV